MDLVLAIQHWRPYLIGNKLQVFTDQNSLRHLLEQKVITQNQQNWIAKLLWYDFDIIYKQGTTNKATDVLSRKLKEPKLKTLSKPYWHDADKVEEEVQQDPILKKISKDPLRDPGSYEAYTLE